jgi:Zn-dependent protease
VRTHLRLGSVAGIPVELHLSFFLIWVLIAFSDAEAAWAERVARASSLSALIVLSVVLHELGHALAARREGVRTLAITLYPVGGIARMTSLEVEPRAELRIAAAGPAVSLALGAAFLGLMLLQNALGWWLPRPLGMLVRDGLHLNLGLGLFNLIPAFPLDGGRMLRAWLSLRRGAERATAAAARLGRLFAGMLVGFGLFGNPMMALLGIFLLALGIGEARNTRLRAAVARAQVGDAMSAPGPLLDGATVPDPALLPAGQAYFAVVEPGTDHLLGLVPRSALLASHAAGHGASIRPLLLPARLSAHPGSRLESVYPAMERMGIEAVPVIFGRSVVGILSWGDLHRFVLGSLQSGRRRAGGSSVAKARQG